MKTDNVSLMRMARESLKGKWGLAIGTFVVYLLIAITLEAIPKLGIIVSLLISGPLAVGVSLFSLSLARNEEARLEQLFDGFKNFLTASTAYILMGVFVLLWMILLIVPGIIAAIAYSMTFFILAEEPSMRAMDAIKKSKKMMEGYKLKYFYLGLRFFGLALLCILTLGIGFFWLIPYIYVTCAKFYDDIKTDQQGVVS